MDHFKCSEATISALEVSEAPNHLFSHQSDTSSVSSAAAECAAYEKRDITKQQTSFNEANYNNTCEGVNPLLKRATKLPAANDNTTSKKKKKKSRLLEHVLFIPKLILHPRRLGKRVRSAFQRSNHKTKDARDSARDECHPASDINTAVSNENKNASCSWGVALTAEEIEMVEEPLYDCFIPTADAQDERHQSDIDNTDICSSWPSGPALTAEEIEMVGEPLYDCFIPTADAQDERHQSDIDNTDICSSWPSGPALTPEEIEMVGVPLYECVIPTAQGEFNQYNAISPPSKEDNEKDSNGEVEDYGDEDQVSIVQCVECCQQDLTNENSLTAYQHVTPFDNEGATADASLQMVSQPLPNDTSNINCDNSDGYKLRMTDEEKRIIEELLADCSPTVQRIINAHNMFTIPPPSYDTESDEEDDSSEEEDDEY